jgi:hypothetical protein
MSEASDQLVQDIDRATRIIGGLTDPHSRSLLRDYIVELEARLAQTRHGPVMQWEETHA